MLKAICKGIDIIWEYFSTLFLCGIILFLTLNVYMFSYIFVLLLMISSIMWLFKAIVKKEKRKTSLIRLAMYLFIFCIFYGYGQYLRINQIAARNEVANMVHDYENRYGEYPSKELVRDFSAKYSKYQMRFFYHLLPITPKQDPQPEIEGYSLFYKTHLLGIFDNVVYLGNHQWEVVYD